MGWYALEEIDEAVEQSKDILLPFNLSTWVKLAVIVVITGQGMNIPSAPTGTSSDSGTYSGDGISTAPSSMSMDTHEDFLRSITPGMNNLEFITAPSILLILVIVIVLLGVLWMILGDIFEFIFYQSLMDKRISIRNSFRRHFTKGLQYFGFSIGLILLSLVLAVILGAVPVAIMSYFTGIGVAAAFIVGSIWLLLLIPTLVVLVLTHNLVLPYMIRNDQSIIESWKRLYPDLRSEYKETLVYLLTRAGLSIVTGVLVMFTVFILIIVVGLPFLLLGMVLSVLHNFLAAFALVGFIAIFLVSLFSIIIPIQVFMYYHALLVSEDFTS